jgi:hypothetical protein
MPPDPLDQLRRDAALLAADPECRQWLIALLTHGERSSGSLAPPPSPPPAPPKRRRPPHDRKRPAPT